MDCSWPLGCSLNDGIDKNIYLGEHTDLKYPTIDSVCKKIYDLSHSSHESIFLYKEYMDRAFRQLYADFCSIPLLGFKWRRRYYFDRVMMMGCRMAPYVCQRTTSMIVYLHNQMGYYLTNYVDDFLGLEYHSVVHQAHGALIRLMRNIGVGRSERKSVAPTQIIEFVGNLNTVDMTLGVTQAHKIQTIKELEQWRHRTSTTRRQMESLIGKLQFMSNCVRPGRLFVSWLLNEMRKMRWGVWYHVSEEARKDIKWWYLFLPKFSGTSIMWLLDAVATDTDISLDACLVGAGGTSHDECFHVKFPSWIKGEGINITHFELWAVIIGIRLWGPNFCGKVLKVQTDNAAVATIINTGRSFDEKLQKQLRELVWWLATYEIKVKSVHLMGRLNKLLDLLSRWEEGVEVRRQFHNLTKHRNMVFKHINNSWLVQVHSRLVIYYCRCSREKKKTKHCLCEVHQMWQCKRDLQEPSHAS